MARTDCVLGELNTLISLWWLRALNDNLQLYDFLLWKKNTKHSKTYSYIPETIANSTC